MLSVKYNRTTGLRSSAYLGKGPCLGSDEQDLGQASHSLHAGNRGTMLDDSAAASISMARTVGRLDRPLVRTSLPGQAHVVSSERPSELLAFLLERLEGTRRDLSWRLLWSRLRGTEWAGGRATRLQGSLTASPFYRWCSQPDRNPWSAFSYWAQHRDLPASGN